ncbi:Uncharacterised protein [uncultured archaeon]|nr:Uncharacterised protein [uncultured archaeon]
MLAFGSLMKVPDAVVEAALLSVYQNPSPFNMYINNLRSLIVVVEPAALLANLPLMLWLPAPRVPIQNVVKPFDLFGSIGEFQVFA